MTIMECKETDHIEALSTKIEFEKAFDTIEWYFLFKKKKLSILD